MKQQRTLFVLCLAIGLTAIWITLPLADNYLFSNGKELIAWYIPLPIALFYFLWNVYADKPVATSAGWSLLLFLLFWIPFVPHLTNTYEYFKQDDGTRYRLVATNMVNHHTLNGGDGAIFGMQDKVYMIQPGYRYYLALWIKIFGDEIRLFQLFNMFLYLGAIVLFFVRTSKVSLPVHFRTGMMAFVFLSSPFVVKLIMMGLTEWLAITIFLLSVSYFFSRQLIPAIILLALLPFIRQNLLFVSLIMVWWMIWKQKQKVLLAIVYLGILLLPLYHNLYYAGKWQFFSVYDDPSTFMAWDFEGSYLMRMIKTTFYHISLYTGINYRLNNFFANALSLACIPLGSFLLVRGYFYLEKNLRGLYLLIVAGAIAPTLIFGGTAYYPRFEWVNLFIGICVFIVLRSNAGSRTTHPIPVNQRMF